LDFDALQDEQKAQIESYSINQTARHRGRYNCHLGWLISLLNRIYLVSFPLALGVALAETLSSSLTIEMILARMAKARDENKALMRPYTLTRNYKLFAKGNNQAKSEVTAEVTFVPPAKRTYKIVRSSGMSLGEKIVRKMLEGETEIVEQSGANDITPENYRFELLQCQEEGGRRFYVLKLIPNRKDKHLLHARIWVDSETFRLHRMSGEPGKTPSWWLRDPHIMFSYAEVGGMWLQVGSESNVDVRLFGQYRMVSHDIAYTMGGSLSLPH